jgi:putative acetyltransferase
MCIVRAETDGDIDAIRRVHQSAFETPMEARLVDRLRENGNATISLVAVSDGGIVGHVLFSPVSIEPEAADRSGLGLAPVAVQPEFQRRGIGTRLIEQGLDACRSIGCDFVVVLGDPAYYARFGFERADRRGFANEYDATDAFMALELRPGALSGRRGMIRYGLEFAEAE